MQKRTDSEIDDCLKSIREDLRIRKKRRRWKSSKLDQFSSDIFAFRAKGATLEELQAMLKRLHKTTVHLSTISRWMKSHGGDSQ